MQRIMGMARKAITEYDMIQNGDRVAVGVSGLFMETHPDPANALSDGPNAVPLDKMKALLQTLKVLDETVKSQPFLENDFGL